MIEAQSRYINALIKPVIEARKQGKMLALSPKKEKLDAYNSEIQHELQNSSFNDPNVSSWYKDDKGNITNNWSRNVVQYQEMLSQVEFADFDLEGTGKNLVSNGKVAKVGRVRYVLVPFFFETRA